MFSNSCIELHVICCGAWLILYHYSLVSHDVKHFLIRLLVFLEMYIYHCIDLHAWSCQWCSCWLLCWNFCIKNVLSLQCRCYQLLSLTNIYMQTNFSLTMQYLIHSRKSDYFWKLVTATQCVNLFASKHVSTETFLNWHNYVHLYPKCIFFCIC